MIAAAFDAAAVAAALAAKAEALRQELEDRVAANLSGAVLQRRSGQLADSFVSDLQESDDGLTASVASVGAPYAAILEYGGKTAAHDIVATKAKALVFVTGGTQGFAAHVHHPGSVIPAFAYLGGALEAMRSEIEDGLKQAVLDALAV